VGEWGGLQATLYPHVVPAKAGTHTPRPALLAKEDNDRRANQLQAIAATQPFGRAADSNWELDLVLCRTADGAIGMSPRCEPHWH